MADFILAGDFRKGITFVMDGNKVMTIVDATSSPAASSK